jgi:imidazole glycerol-phosphate synthase subunit HisH
VISVVDYGMGNLGSVLNMMKYLNIDCTLIDDPNKLKSAEKIILPGVGAFDRAMQTINRMGFRDILEEKALNQRVPVLGICLGMQLLTNGSEEGAMPGLGWIGGESRRFRKHSDLKVPHMGWNNAAPATPCELTEGLSEKNRYYFVHSYYVEVEDPKNSIMKTQYGHVFDSGIQHDNVYGVQFHPEKSHKYGMQLLKNFAAL